MSIFHIKVYTPDLFDIWNKFVDNSNNGTVFHRLDFLAYHKYRFKENEHHLILFKGETIYSVLPLALFKKDGKWLARSPYGASYGGPVFSKPLNYSESKLIVYSLKDYFIDQGINELKMTFPIRIVEEIHSETFYLALLENNFMLKNSDISSIVCLDNSNIENITFTSRARNMARKAAKAGVIVQLRANIDDFWTVMEKTFNKHSANPTHTFKQWKWLCHNLPGDIWCDVAYLKGKPVAGLGHIRINSKVDSSFYLCSDPEYLKTQALSLLIYQSIMNAKKVGYKYFDFGTSSVDLVGKGNIFKFKESFGAIGIFRNTFIWKNNE